MWVPLQTEAVKSCGLPPSLSCLATVTVCGLRDMCFRQYSSEMEVLCVSKPTLEESRPTGVRLCMSEKKTFIALFLLSYSLV